MRRDAPYGIELPRQTTLNERATRTLRRSHQANFDQAKQGVVTAFLRDFNPATSTYTTIATATLTVANWQGGSTTWVQKTLTMSASNYTVVAGRRIGLKIIVTAAAADDMWFAYDTTTNNSTLALP